MDWKKVLKWVVIMTVIGAVFRNSQQIISVEGDVTTLQTDVVQLTTDVEQLATGTAPENTALTWIYYSADDPSYGIMGSGDLTTTISPGMRMRVMQGTEKWFIVTNVGGYSGGYTDFTIYGGTDYDLTTDEITSVTWSSAKAPYGFPLDPDKWTVESIWSTDVSQASPTTDTWYNLGSIYIDVPPGAWFISYQVYAYNSVTGSASNEFQVSLSDDASSGSNDYTTALLAYGQGSMGGIMRISNVPLSVIYKTTYYLNMRSTQAISVPFLNFANSSYPAIIRAVCAYL